MTLFRGSGGSWYPHTPILERVIIGRATVQPERKRSEAPKVIFASTNMEQALEYTADNQETQLSTVTPEAGSVVRWMPGVRDMVMDFERFLRDLTWDRSSTSAPGHLRLFLADVAGDTGIFERYLELGRQKRATQTVVDLYLGQKVLEERTVVTVADLELELQGHEGEVWLTAPYTVEPYMPAPSLSP